jgi:hypothetical protein
MIRARQKFERCDGPWILRAAASMLTITLKQQSEALARRRAELGERVPSVPANAGGRRTVSKLALLDRLDELDAASRQPPKFIRHR